MATTSYTTAAGSGDFTRRATSSAIRSDGHRAGRLRPLQQTGGHHDRDAKLWRLHRIRLPLEAVISRAALPHPRSDLMDTAQGDCGRYNKRAVITTVTRNYGDYIVYDCRWKR